ncbi:hypothetical protein F5144DRAFT_641454 [Chaetomium tenue]|uniref:Uncharacterized protein n=1 Tax=Chaetomium tenue TaxID=1854479 RepID=A0ACB7PKK3_9PEZI|nr:hypothetical protein F5144DRAFT_641454 [Chaetomium globosum]
MSSGAGRDSRKGSLGSIDGSSHEAQTVGTLLAAIARCLTEAVRILMFADKRQWGPDEFEQTRVLEEALDEAKKDFQEMAPLVHGQFYYENDRTPESLHTLQSLLTRFQFHTQNFRDWARQGGPINPTWARETAHLRRALHRAQCRAATRIFAATVADQESPARCLGAFHVHRRLKRAQVAREGERMPVWQRGGEGSGDGRGGGRGGGGQGLEASRRAGDLEVAAEAAAAGRGEGDDGGGGGGGGGEGPTLGRRRSLEELVPSCNEVGRFQVLGESHDAAFVCDYCEGFIVWPDLSSIPSERMPLAPTAVTGYPHWQAKGISADNGEEKVVVFAPLAIANHMPPEPGGWQAGLICPYCEEATYLDEGEDSSELKYVQDESGFPDLEAFREHLEWYHTAMPVPPISSLASTLPSASNCSVM